MEELSVCIKNFGASEDEQVSGEMSRQEEN
jgi:hypothetical protein